MKKHVFIFSLFICLFSCNNSNKNNDKPSEKAIIEDHKELIIKLDFKTNTKDVFRIVLNNIIIDEFQKKNIQIHETVPVSNDFENITAFFGKNNISNQIVFNLGKEPKKVEYNNIEFSYGNNTVQITNENFNKYIRLNKFIEYNEIDFSLTTKVVDGKHNPVFFARKTLIDYLKKEVQQTQ